MGSRASRTMKLAPAVLLAVQAEAKDHVFGRKVGRKNAKGPGPLAVRSTLGHLSYSSAQAIAAAQVGDSFPHRADIAYTQSQAAMMASFGVPVSTAHIAQTPSWEEQLETGERGALSDTVLDGRLWNQFTSTAGCEPATDASCKWLIPYYFDDEPGTAVRAAATTAMADIEAKTCLRFQFLVNPAASTYVNNKKLRIVTSTNLCSSFVGASYVNQDLFLSATTANDCGVNSAAVEHELLHSIGMFHENQRADAETHLTFTMANVDLTMSQADINADYGIIPAENHLTFNSNYDFASIMQLPSAKNGENGANAFVKTSDSLPIVVADIATTLTDEDAWQINSLYGCTAYLTENFLECSQTATVGDELHFKVDPTLLCDGNNDPICPDDSGGNADNSDEANCDDCSRGNHSCVAEATCGHDVITLDHDSCSCDVTLSTGTVSTYMTGDGYNTVSGGSGCTDNNECVDVQSCNDGTNRLECRNVFPGYECVCPAGQEHGAANALNDFEHLASCQDKDECADGSHKCGSNMQCQNTACGTHGQACTFDSETGNGTYECLCKDGSSATGDENNLVCPDIDECSLDAYGDTATIFAAMPEAAGVSVYMARPACERCAETGFYPTAACLILYDAGYVCINSDTTTDATSFDCRCPAGSNLIRYTNDYLRQIDEENDNEVNGVIAVDAMVGWTQPVENQLVIEFTVAQTLTGTFSSATSFTATFDPVTLTWSSEIPLQCVEYERCPTLQCPNRSAVNVGCTDNAVYSVDTNFDGARSPATFWDLDTQDSTLVDGVTEGLPTCATCDNSLTEFDETTFSCVDTDECAAITDAMYDAMLNTSGSVTDYNDAMALKCGATAPVTALPDGWVGANHQSAVCVNASPTATNDGYSCECPEGSELAADGSACEDIKECASGAHTCGNQQCIDYCMHGSSDGITGPATYLADGTTCSFDGTTAAAYGKPGGGFTCYCPEGLEWSHDANDCVDIDECAADVDPCAGNAGTECVNARGDFYCACSAGFHSDVVASQFLQADGTTYIAPADCTNSVECDKTIAALNPSNVYCGSNSCACTAGGECALACYDADGVLTVGAILGNNCHTCHANGLCTQKTGAGFECSCPSNSAHNGVDACDDGAQCGPGLEGTIDCDAQGLTCLEGDVSYTCGCPVDSGYSLVNDECVDDDECNGATPCGANGNCVNEPGGYSCGCHDGFELTIPGRTLIALPNSAMNSLRTSVGGRSPAGIVSDPWQIFAINQQASVSRTGERTDQFTCLDTDERTTGKDVCMLLEEGGVCTNTDGTHTCACADGYTGDGYSTERYTAANAAEGFVAPGGVDPATYTGCADVDECTLYTDICGADTECTNTVGSYT